MSVRFGLISDGGVSVVVIGAGGVAAFFAPTLARVCGSPRCSVAGGRVRIGVRARKEASGGGNCPLQPVGHAS